VKRENQRGSSGEGLRALGDADDRVQVQARGGEASVRLPTPRLAHALRLDGLLEPDVEPLLLDFDGVRTEALRPSRKGTRCGAVSMAGVRRGHLLPSVAHVARRRRRRIERAEPRQANLGGAAQRRGGSGMCTRA
jgi:hypothetical protein